MQDQHGACCRDAASGGAEHATKYFCLLYMQADENLHATRESRGRYPRECRAAGVGCRIVFGLPFFLLYTNVIPILCPFARSTGRGDERSSIIHDVRLAVKFDVVIERSGFHEIADRTLELRHFVA